MADDPGNGAGYASYMNFFLPQSARVGSSQASTPGLFDLLGGMGIGGWPGSSSSASAPVTPADQQKKQQQQQLAMAQQGMKMLQPQPPSQIAPDQSPPQQQMAPQQPQQPLPMPQPPPPVRYDPRDPRNRNPIAGMPTPFGGFYR